MRIKREPSLRWRISRRCNCSRRSIYLPDKHYDFPSDAEMDAFIMHAKLMESKRAPKLPQRDESAKEFDCDDDAREFWCRSKRYFKARGLNAASALICRRATALQKAHCFNFYIRKSDLRLVFIDNFERVPFYGRTYFVIM